MASNVQNLCISFTKIFCQSEFMSRLPLPDNPPTISSSVFLNNIPQQIFWNTTPWQFPYVLEIFVCLEEISVHTNLPMYDSYTWALPSGLLHTHNKDVVIECPSHSLWLTKWGGSRETSENPSRKRVIRFRRPSCRSRSSHRSRRDRKPALHSVCYILACPSRLELLSHGSVWISQKSWNILWSV